MVAELIRYRELLWQMTLRDLRARYKQAVMGFGWAVLMPVMVVAAGALVKYAMARMAGSTVRPGDLASMAVKAVPWTFFVGAVGFATSSLTGNLSLVTKIYFPREVFPLSAVLTQVFDSAVGSACVMLLVLGLGVGWSVQLLWVPLLAVLTVLLTSAAALALSCGNLFFRDVKYVVQVFLTFGIFFTPVLYDAPVFGPLGCPLMMLNPLAPLLEGLRLAVAGHHNLALPLVAAVAGEKVLVWHPGYLVYSGVWATFGTVGAWWLFHKLEFVYAEYA
jgi:ABC-type polysaccharide/polyol phosphate export permease